MSALQLSSPALSLCLRSQALENSTCLASHARLQFVADVRVKGRGALFRADLLFRSSEQPASCSIERPSRGGVEIRFQKRRILKQF